MTAIVGMNNSKNPYKEVIKPVVPCKLWTAAFGLYNMRRLLFSSSCLYDNSAESVRNTVLGYSCILQPLPGILFSFRFKIYHAP